MWIYSKYGNECNQNIRNKLTGPIAESSFLSSRWRDDRDQDADTAFSTSLPGYTPVRMP